VAIRDQVDIDSLDALRFFVELHRRLGVDIPERDYPKLASVDNAVAYLQPRVPAA
jgi:acyl carrier protein